MDFNKNFKLNDESFHSKKFEKTRIFIGDTLNVGMGHFNNWGNKLNGNYKRTATYSILLNGSIHEHFNPEFFSDFLNDKQLDKYSISIVLENEGWLVKNFKLNKFINWSGSIYNRDGIVIKKSWRNKLNWSPYSDSQMDSLVILCNHLIKTFNINRYISPDNLIISDFSKEFGIYYKSNHNKRCTDVSPAFDFKKFKEKIENGKN